MDIQTSAVKMILSNPIYIIGAGGIVNSAHLPAYAIAGYDVQGIYDLDREKAEATATRFKVPHVFATLAEMIAHAPGNAVFDIAVPGSQIIPLLRQLPEGAAVLLQKPMGETYKEAKEILALTSAKKMLAAVNFQLRYAPYIIAAKDLIDKGQIGELNDIEINVNAYTPWHLWDFLTTSPRVEILYHSIHYIDLIRNLLGNPKSVYAKTNRHPAMPQLASVRSNIIMDYGEMIRANILTNHCHNYGTAKQQSYIKLEGSRGAIIIHFGALVNYPTGTADSFEFILLNGEGAEQWQAMQIEGSWFPHAFIGSMRQVLMAKQGIIERPDNDVSDCIHTMACLEAAYISNEQGGIKPNSL